MSERFPSQTQDKFTVRFPEGMRDAIAERAKANGRSMNSEIIQMLQDAFEKEKFTDYMLDHSMEEIVSSKEGLNVIIDQLKKIAENIDDKKPE
ncbi:Arc family DNA-binding protein [Rosenbergiella australiborealis]|uniref:Arc family DNA-binding protein n=1 Tax=Rosenbergiella australiborealis TaxID=1544696 RepID=UPI001F4D828E|nr:Arc family DNA-binding protein [Rosenbergiella australiborealis]